MPRPNILLITTDQQRFDTIQCAGNPYIYTPHLNWLEDTGIRFGNAYSDSPVCIPARATIMSGRYGSSLGITQNAMVPTPIRSEYGLPGLLTRAGYQTRAQGKMHFIPNRCHYGFEQMELMEDYYHYMAEHPECGVPMDHGMGMNEMAPVISTVHETQGLIHWTVKRSIDFLETRDATRPFFLWTSFLAPHPPLDPSRNYWELYRDRPVPEPIHGDWSRRIEDVPEGWRHASVFLSMAQRYSDEQLRDIRRAYYACITEIDYSLGLLFARMREMKLLENTLILFTSDHGEMLGDHFMGAKSVGLEGSAHIPLLVRPPQGDWAAPQPWRGTTCDELVCLADVLPTCLQFAGVEIPAAAQVEGIDLLAAAGGKAQRALLFGEAETYHYVRQGDYKYLFEAWGGSELLFDLRADPYEQHDLIRAGTHQPVRQELASRLTEHLQKRNHPAVKSGRLAGQDPHTRKPVVANRWPGFYSHNLPG